MSIILFAIIGGYLNASVWYWLCFSAYCISSIVKASVETIKEQF